MLDVGEPAGVAQSGIVAVIAEPPRFLSVCLCNDGSFRNAEHHVAAVAGRSQPRPVVLYQREHLLVGYSVHVSDDGELLAAVGDPPQELAEERERRVGDDDVGALAQCCYLARAEVAVALEVVPAQVVDVYAVVAVHVAVEHEDPAVGLPPGGVELGVSLSVAVEERGLYAVLRQLGVGGVAGGYEAAYAEELEVQCEVPREVAPFGVVAGHEYGLVAEGVGVVAEVCLHLVLNVGQLRVELVVFRRLCRAEAVVACHGVCACVGLSCVLQSMAKVTKNQTRRHSAPPKG